MAEFNYTIPIPQPNTNMFGGGFFQGLQAIEGIRSARAQQALEQQLAPLRLQQAELGVQSQRQQMELSAAAARRAAESFQLNKQAALAAQERERNVANMIAEYGLDPEKDLSALAPILPTLDKNRLDALRQVEAMKIGNAFQQIDPESPDPEAIRKLSARSLILDTDEGKRFDGLLASLPNPAKEKLIDTALQVSNAGMAGNNDVAKKRLEEVASAYSGSRDARFQQLGKLMTQTLESVPENATPSYWALLGQTLMFRTGDEKAIGKFNDIITSYSKETSPEAVAKTQSETAKNEAAALKDRMQAAAEEAKAQGILPSEEKFKMEGQLRQDFIKSKTYVDQVARTDALFAIQDALSQQSGPADVSAVQAFVKLGDPNSTVSVTESGQITGADLPATTRTLLEKLLGQGLNNIERAKLIQAAQDRYKNNSKVFESLANDTTRNALEFKLNPKNIVYLREDLMSPKMVADSVLKALREGKKVPAESLRPVQQGKEMSVGTQTRQEQLRGKSVPPPVPTGAAPAGTGMSAIDAAIQKYRSK